MRKTLMLLALLVFAAVVMQVPPALSGPEDEKGVPDYLKAENKLYQEKYNLEQFKLTDTNGDGFLSPDELAARPAWKGGYFFGADDERIALADKDGDKLISLEEAKAEKQWEIEHAEELNKKYGKELKTWYNNKEWLMEHPEVLAKLVTHTNWLDDHPIITKELYKNRVWLAKHPEVAGNIYSNREWLAKHPRVAKEFYENTEFLDKHPEFKKDAEKFFAEHPEMQQQEGVKQ
jgi:hypothetical protein